MGHLPVLQEGGAKALRGELFGTFPGDRFIQKGGARALRRECFGSLARWPVRPCGADGLEPSSCMF